MLALPTAGVSVSGSIVHEAREEGGGIAVNDDIIMNKSRIVEHTFKLIVRARGQVEDVAGWFGALGRILARPRGYHGALSAVVGILFRVEGSGGDVEAEDGALEDLVRGFGLVGGDFVAGLVDAREGVVAVLAYLATDVAGVDDDIGVAGGAEGGALAIVYGEGSAFAADPCDGKTKTG